VIIHRRFVYPVRITHPSMETGERTPASNKKAWRLWFSSFERPRCGDTSSPFQKFAQQGRFRASSNGFLDRRSRKCHQIVSQHPLTRSACRALVMVQARNIACTAWTALVESSRLWGSPLPAPSLFLREVAGVVTGQLLRALGLTEKLFQRLSASPYCPVK
jgi:hypothetical protein